MFDADWQLNHISLVHNGTKVAINGRPYMEASLFEEIKEDLLAFNQNKTDSVDFISSEQQILIFLTRQNDKIEVAGEIYNRWPENSEYITKFNFKTDSDLLGKFIAGIEKILIEYPSRRWIGDWC